MTLMTLMTLFRSLAKSNFNIVSHFDTVIRSNTTFTLNLAYQV